MLPKYEVIEHPNGFHDDHWCIQILEGEYEGLIYQYDVINMSEGTEEEGAMLTFNTITVDNPNNVDLTEENDKGIMGGILVDIISEQMENLESENGTPDTQESATE